MQEAYEELKLGASTKMMNSLNGFIMPQMSAKVGIKKHGKHAIESLFTEFLQLHDKSVFEGRHAYELSRDQKRASLRAISVIKEKGCVIVSP